ncbi:hypothetical protein ACP4OV_001067 [Aristida adscensionis]
MAQCGGGNGGGSLSRHETLESLCQGLLGLDGGDDRLGAMCSAFGYLQEWPDMGGMMCCTNLGAPGGAAALEAGAGNDDSSCSGSGGAGGDCRKRRPEACLDAKDDGSAVCKKPRGKQQACDLGEAAGAAKGAKQERPRAGTKKKAEAASPAAAAAAGTKTDYIHVRARRGQATDSHSLAERVRRERISERMRYLQELVPGCSKVTGKAGMLDEIINYVQSLQKQVEFLSMKIAASNPVVSFDIVEDLFGRQLKQACGSPAAPPVAAPPEPPCLQTSPMQQVHAHSSAASPGFGLEMVVNNLYSPAATGASIGSCLDVNGAVPWDIGSQNLFSGFDAAFQSVESDCFPDNLKMEM